MCGKGELMDLGQKKRRGKGCWGGGRLRDLETNDENLG